MPPESEKRMVEITLRFKTEDDKRAFMGGLSDGFGEAHCDLGWNYEEFTEEQIRSGEAFHSVRVFDVDVFDTD